MGELHLDIIVDRLRREFKVEANVGAANGMLTVKQFRAEQLNVKVNTSSQSGGRGQYGHVWIKFDTS